MPSGQAHRLRQHGIGARALAVLVATVLGVASGCAGRVPSRPGALAGPPASCAGQPPGCGVGPGTSAALSRGSWSTIPASPLSQRADSAVVWTGKSLVVWGGEDIRPFADGAYYDPAAQRWHRTAPSPLSPRDNVAAVWAANEVFLWGGDDNYWARGNEDGPPRYFADGATYHPASNSWHLVPSAPLSPRSGAQAFWTGSQVVVFGGQTNASFSLDGASFDPVSGVWSKLPPFPAVSFPGHQPGAATSLTTAWTGQELLVWVTYAYRVPYSGGTYSFAPLYRAAAWAPGSSSRQVLAPSPPQVHTYVATATWTGREVVFLGGSGWCPNYGGYTCNSTASAGTYDPASGTWKALPFQASTWPSVWTGSALVVLDDKVGFPTGVTGPPGQAASFDPSSGRWTELPAPPKALSAKLEVATLVWTGRQVLAWSGGAMTGNPPLVEAYTPTTK